MTRRTAWPVAMAAVVLIVSAGCSGKSSGQPQNLSPGRLQDLSAAGLSQPVVNGGAIPVLPNQPADFTVYVMNTARTPVQLVSAALIPVPAYPAARLAHLGVGIGKNVIDAGRGWPSDVPTRALSGAQLPSGQSNIIIGIDGASAGRDYAVAGLKIYYRAHGRVNHLMAWSVGLACVRNKVGPRYPACAVTLGNVITAVRRMAGLSP